MNPPRRLSYEAYKTEKSKKTIGSWGIGLGAYLNFNDPTFVDYPYDFDKFSSLELRLVELIELDLKTKSKRPIRVLDFGGGSSYSFVKLAKKFEKEILAGELVLVSSNLEALPEQSVLAKKLEDYDIEQKNLDEYFKYYKLVRNFQGDSQDLKDEFGEGSFDLIHESYALTHSYFPIEDFRNIYALLGNLSWFLFNSNRPHPDGIDELDLIKSEFEDALSEILNNPNNFAEKLEHSGYYQILKAWPDL